MGVLSGDLGGLPGGGMPFLAAIIFFCFLDSLGFLAFFGRFGGPLGSA
jgi:hypothetical protein